VSLKLSSSSSGSSLMEEVREWSSLALFMGGGSATVPDDVQEPVSDSDS
jgi:hypothetical protein